MSSEPRLVAILVGLKNVDPNHYNGWNGENGCEGCEKDVDHMQSLLAPLQYSFTILKTAAATRAGITTAIGEQAANLKSGDTLVFYFAGHGGQQTDANGDETDGKDETLVAYDGVLVDDELSDLWLKFQAGVRLFMLSDSCNSGTNFRNFPGEARTAFSKATPLRPLTVNAVRTMQAQLIHISGCRDGETSAGYAEGGAFTTALMEVWNGGRFPGVYRKFRDEIAKQLKQHMGEAQLPQYNEYGPVTGSFSAQKPFMPSNWGFLLHTSTALHETDETFEFLLAPNKDLFVIKKRNTGRHSTEVHILSASSGYQRFSHQTGTALHETDNTFRFMIATNLDIFAIKKSNTGSHSTEVHILSSRSSYQEFSLQTGTALHETDETFEFLLAPNRDIFAIKKNRTGTTSTEVHVLSAGSGYQNFIMQTGTILHEADETFEFLLAPNRDIFAIKKNKTGSTSTEVHGLLAERNYQAWFIETGTVLHETDNTFSFCLTNERDLMAIKKKGTGTGTTEVHIVDLPPWKH